MSKQIIYRELSILAIGLGQEQNPQRLSMFTEELLDFNTEETVRAIRSFRKTAKFFPQLVELVDRIKGLEIPSDEMANIIANEIIECISKYGPYQVKECKEHLGENWGIVERSGGWDSLCKIEYSEVPTTKAQLRELAKAYINRSKMHARIDNETDYKLDTRSPAMIRDENGRELNPLILADAQKILALTSND